MLTLGIDTTAQYCSVAMVDDGRTLTVDQARMERGQSEMLLPAIVRALTAAQRDFGDIAAIGVTTGPGAFTGIRIGLATARGLALALGIPCVGIDSFRALAQHTKLSAATEEDILAVIDARRQSVFAQIFSANGEPDGEPFESTPEDLLARIGDRALRVIGNGAVLIDPAHDEAIHIAAEIDAPDPVAIARAAAAGVGTDADLPRPFYLRPADARPNPARRKAASDTV